MQSSPLTLNQQHAENRTRMDLMQSEAMIQARSYRSSRFITILAFLSGMGLMIHVRLGVRLSLTELFAPFLFVAMSAGLRELLANRVIRNLIFFIGLNLVGIVVSDLLGDVPFMDTMKGVAKPVFILLLAINFGLLFVHGVRFLIPIYFGFFVGSVLHLFFNTGDDLYDFSLSSMDYAFFVFRVSTAVNLSAGIAGFYLLKVNRFLGLVPMVVAMVISVVFSSRSAMVVWFAATCALIYATRWTAINWVSVYSPKRVIWAFFSGSFVLGMISYLIHIEVSKLDLLSQTSKQKANIEQLDNSIGYGPIGLLMAGRAEVVGSILMIADSPIIGHGTSSLCGDYFVRAFHLANQRRTADSAQLDAEMRHEKIMTGHSIMFHSWASHGILALPLWLFILSSLFRSLTVLLLVKSPYTPFLVLQVISLFWDIFFSPLAVQTRAWIPLSLAFFAFYIPQVQHEAAFHLMQWNRSSRSPIGKPAVA